jgi:branched-subunit amino acid permease
MSMGILVVTGMETMDTISAMVMDIITVEGMATTIMATRDTTTTLEEGMVITMEVIMAIAIAMTRIGCRRTLAKCYASSATTRGIMPMIALRRKQRRDSSQTHFRRDMLTMSMLRKFRRNPML